MTINPLVPSDKVAKQILDEMLEAHKSIFHSSLKGREVKAALFSPLFILLGGIMMIKLIVNADDFGLTEGTNYGIIDGHINGLVNSTTMMMNMPGTEHAVRLAKEYNLLGVGVHLVLTAGEPLLGDVPSLVGSDGSFHKQSVVREGI